MKFKWLLTLDIANNLIELLWLREIIKNYKYFQIKRLNRAYDHRSMTRLGQDQSDQMEIFFQYLAI